MVKFNNDTAKCYNDTVTQWPNIECTWHSVTSMHGKHNGVAQWLDHWHVRWQCIDATAWLTRHVSTLILVMQQHIVHVMTQTMRWLNQRDDWHVNPLTSQRVMVNRNIAMAARPMQYLTTSSTQVGTSSSVVAAQLAEPAPAYVSFCTALASNPTSNQFVLDLCRPTLRADHYNQTAWSHHKVHPMDDIFALASRLGTCQWHTCYHCGECFLVVIFQLLLKRLSRMQIICNNTSQMRNDQPYSAPFRLSRRYKLHGRQSSNSGVSRNTRRRYRAASTNCASTTTNLTTSLSMFSCSVWYIIYIVIVFLTIWQLVLHLYYKIDYIKMQWGGPEEQAKERAAGNANTVNWHDEAMKVLEWAIDDYWNDEETAPTRKNPPAKPAASVTLPKV